MEERLIRMLKDMGISPGDPKFNDAFRDLVKQTVAEIQKDRKIARERFRILETPVENEGNLAAHTRAQQISSVAIRMHELRTRMLKIKPLAKRLGVEIEEGEDEPVAIPA